MGEDHHRELDQYAKLCYDPSHKTPPVSTDQEPVKTPGPDTVEKVEVVR
jgi:hypothetical protein